MKPRDFFRFFNVDKSTHTQINRDGTGYDYYPKHENRLGRVVWDSKRKGTYIRERDGAL